MANLTCDSALIDFDAIPTRLVCKMSSSMYWCNQRRKVGYKGARCPQAFSSTLELSTNNMTKTSQGRNPKTFHKKNSCY
ncbi:hypothetical protein ACTXT7_000047 [Hymenolepis weldensis]